jgi:hypothetical protein
LKTKLKIAFLFLLIAALGGLLLRMTYIGIPVHNYKYVMHAHSHVALLGWIYNAVLIVFQYLIFRESKGKLNRLFWLSQITFAGMLVSFPVQGYGLFSITFSTLYLLLSYYLVYVYFKKSRHIKNPVVSGFVKWGGIYLILSSMGPYALGVIMATGLEDTFWYKLSVYWFIHFLYNGFFVFAVFAVLFNQIKTGFAVQKMIFRLMNLSVIPLYLLSVLWLKPALAFYAGALLAAALQLIAVIMLFKILPHNLFQNRFGKALLMLSLAVYFLKTLMQIAASFVIVQDFLSVTVSSSIIGYLHLVMLGFFSLFFLAVLIEHQMIHTGKWLQTGIVLFVLGIVLSEIMLFSQSIVTGILGQFIPGYFNMLFWSSALIPLGVLLMVVQLLKKH